MNKFLTLTSTSALIFGVFLIAGCSSSGGDDDSGGSNGSGGTATVPANAIVINDTNAEATILSITTLSNTFDAALGVQATPIVGLKATLDAIIPFIKNRSNNSGVDLATGVDVNRTENCSGGGTASFIGTETDTSESITATFVNCTEAGFTIHGTLSANFTENASTGDYSDDLTGSLSIIITGSESITLSMTGINIKETGNTFSNNYTTTSLTFAIDFVSSGSGSGGFLVELLSPVIETNGNDCPESGHIRVTGANGTTAEGIFNGDGVSLTIKANGTIVNDSAFCI